MRHQRAVEAANFCAFMGKPMIIVSSSLRFGTGYGPWSSVFPSTVRIAHRFCIMAVMAVAGIGQVATLEITRDHSDEDLLL